MTGYRAEDLLATITDLVGLAPRATGTPGGAAAAQYVLDRFTRAGLTARLWEVGSFAWSASHVALRVGEEDLPCSAILHSGLPATDAVGELRHDTGSVRVVDVGAEGVGERDVRGAIVLFDLAFEMSLYHLLPLGEYLHDPGRRMLRREVLGARNPYVTSLSRTMSAAAAAGAVGLIGVLRAYPESLAYHNEYYRRTRFPLPGVWVTARTGERLRARLVADDSARLQLTAHRRAVTSQSVLGELRGRTRETVMVQSHHDSVGPGAVEDASGAAEVIALAEHYGARAARGGVPPKTLLFATFDTHFTGYQAHQEFARRYALARDSPYDLVLNATIEHVGRRAVRGPDGGFRTLRQTEPRGVFENVNLAFKRDLVRAIRRHRLGATTLLNASLLEFTAQGIPTDASFTLVCGVPTVSLISGPLYLYDDADTLDKVDVEQLVPVARFFTDVVDRGLRSRGATIGLVPAPLRRRLPRGIR